MGSKNRTKFEASNQPKKIKEFDTIFLQSLMGKVKNNLRKIADNGVLSLFNKLKIKDK